MPKLSSEPEIMIPVTCPECGKETLCTLVVAVAADALLGGGSIPLRSSCHNQEWDADLLEREQLREYLGSTSIRGGVTLPTGQSANMKPATSLPPYSILRHLESGQQV
jgi:hypothetical protein